MCSNVHRSLGTPVEVTSTDVYKEDLKKPGKREAL
jgi:hypothetical protein